MNASSSLSIDNAAKGPGGDLLREFQRLKHKPADESRGGNNSLPSLSQDLVLK